MIKNTTNNQKLGWVLFLLYLILLVYFLFFAEEFGRTTRPQDTYAYNLEPFKEIRRFWVYRDVVGLKSFLLNVIGNIVGFVPAGFFLPIVSRRSKKWYNTFLICFLFSLSVETVQLVFKVGSFDVDDIMLNVTGAVLGYILYRIVQMVRSRHRVKKKRSRTRNA